MVLDNLWICKRWDSESYTRWLAEPQVLWEQGGDGELYQTPYGSTCNSPCYFGSEFLISIDWQSYCIMYGCKEWFVPWGKHAVLLPVLLNGEKTSWEGCLQADLLFVLGYCWGYLDYINTALCILQFQNCLSSYMITFCTEEWRRFQAFRFQKGF